MFASVVDSFKENMARLGYREGENITYDIHRLAFYTTDNEQIIEKFLTDKVDLIFVFPTEPALFAKMAAADANIPVLFVGDVEGTDLVETVQRPGGNITGVRIGALDSTVKRLELLHEIMPGPRKVYLPYQKEYPVTASILTALREMASGMDIELVEVPITNTEDLNTDLARRGKTSDIGLDAILMMPNPLVGIPPSWDAIVRFAAGHRLPIIGATHNQILSGAVLSFLAQNSNLGSMAAISAKKILEGMPAGTIPVYTPQLHLIINYKQAQLIGLNLDKGVLDIADQIIQ